MKKHKDKKKLVLFDIDGTLIRSGDVKLRRRFEHVFEAVYGVKQSVRWELHDGTGDLRIFLTELAAAGLTREEIEEKLPQAFAEASRYFDAHAHSDYTKWLLPGAVSCVETISTKAYVGTLTGNLEAVAWRKLELIGLRHYFSFGVFGSEADDRIGIAKLAHPRARQHFGFSFHPHDVIVIGDTPNDIFCARAIGARVIAVATGRFTVSDLAPHNPDLLVKSLEDERIIQFAEGNV